MQTYPAVNTQVIGQAESALGALLGPILVRTGTSFHQWLVLTVTTAGGGELDRGQLVNRISGARKIDPAEVESAIGELNALGLVQGSSLVSLTERGQARYGQIRRAIDELSTRLFDFPDEDLRTAGRVLSIVTMRANAELAAGDARRAR
jgi:DNA-binding MarR family transcriptional regulator